MNMEEVIRKCEEFGFNEQITREMLWNEAYRLGRSRWWWGPSWAVNLTGGINTIKCRMEIHRWVYIGDIDPASGSILRMTLFKKCLRCGKRKIIS